MIIASMTSWPPRIHFVSRSIRSLMSQTVVPDRIELNLATENFPNKENQLPEDLVKLTERGLNINWVEKDVNVFKKVSPTMKKYRGKDYILLSCDDDTEYNEAYVESIVRALGDFDFFCPYPGVVGFIYAMNSRIASPMFWEAITPELIKNGIGDSYIMSYLRRVCAKCRLGGVEAIKGMVHQFGCDTSPNSARIGGYTRERVLEAERLAEKALDRYQGIK